MTINNDRDTEIQIMIKDNDYWESKLRFFSVITFVDISLLSCSLSLIINFPHCHYYNYYYYLNHFSSLLSSLSPTQCKAFLQEHRKSNNKLLLNNITNKMGPKTRHFCGVLPEGSRRGSHVRRVVGSDRLPGGDDAAPLGTPSPSPWCSCEPRPQPPPSPARYS